jgi:hypothetical protein
MNRREAFEASLHGSRRAQGLLLRRYGITPTERNLTVLVRYASRVRRARWWGVVGVLIAATLGWLGSSGETAGVSLSRLFAGYLIGSGVAEFTSRPRTAQGSAHMASLFPRVPSSLLPAWGQLLPWLSLVPCLAAPLLLIGDHPDGVTRVRDRFGSAMATASWFSPSVIVWTALLALGALLVWRTTLRTLAARPLPLDDEDDARVDLLTRLLSARAVSGSAAAVGLSLLGGLALSSPAPLMSMVCPSVSDCHYVYGWHQHYELLQNLGGLLVLTAILLFLFSRLPRLDPAKLHTAVPAST